MDWSEQCPERGAALGHAHWKDCDPAKGHPDDGGPNVGHVHDWATCCHCEQRIGSVSSTPRSTEPEPEPVAVTADHSYVPSMWGICVRCREPMAVHPLGLTTPEADRQAEENALPKSCTLDHKTLTPRLLIGDEGYIWTSCPQCGIILEPAMAKGEYPRAWGIGRGALLQRDARRVLARVGWRAWLALHGGGEGAPPSDT